MATGPGNTCRTDLEVLMTRLKQLREYRSRLATDSATVLEKFIAKGRPEGEMEILRHHLNWVNLRIHLINEEVNRIIASDPRVLQAPQQAISK